VEESGCGLVTIIVARLNQSHVPTALLLPPGLSEYYEAPFRYRPLAVATIDAVALLRHPPLVFLTMKCRIR
jgi:hypothetical protein